MGRSKHSSKSKASRAAKGPLESTSTVPPSLDYVPAAGGATSNQDQERLEQEALARRVTALQDFLSPDSVAAAQSGNQDAEVDELEIQQAIAALRRLPEEPTEQKKQKKSQKKHKESSKSDSKGKRKSRKSRHGDDSDSATDTARASEFAIDPNLREAEGVVHEAPLGTSGVQVAESGRGTTNAVLDESGHHVLLPAIQNNGNIIDAGSLPTESTKKKRGRPKKSQTNKAAEHSNNLPDNQDHEIPTQTSEVLGIETLPDQKRRGRGRPRKIPPDQSISSANPEKRKANDVVVNGSAEVGEAEAQHEDNEQDEFQPRSPKRLKTSRSNENGVLADIEDHAGADPSVDVPANDDHDDLPESGPLIKKEQHILDEALKQYREARSMEQSEVNDLIQNTNRTQSELVKEMWTHLYDALPQRPHVSVMRAARRRYHNYAVRGKWSSADDEALKEANAMYPGKWVKIGSILSRMPEDCRDRWRNYLACGEDRRTDDWSEREERELKQAVEDCCQAIRFEAKERAKAEGHAFREQDWESMVNFNNVSEKMNHTRSRLQCYTHWRVMRRRDGEGIAPKKPERTPGSAPHHRLSRALAKYEKMTPADKFEILNEISASKPVDEESINWKAITRSNANAGWTTRDRKETWAKLKQLIEPQETIQDTLDTISKWFTDRYIPEQLVVQGKADSQQTEEAAEEMDVEQVVIDPAITSSEAAGQQETAQEPPKGRKRKRKQKKEKEEKKEKKGKKGKRVKSNAAVQDSDSDQASDSANETFHDAQTGNSAYDVAALYGQDIQDVHLAQALQGIAQLSQERGVLRPSRAE